MNAPPLILECIEDRTAPRHERYAVWLSNSGEQCAIALGIGPTRDDAVMQALASVADVLAQLNDQDLPLGVIELDKW